MREIYKFGPFRADLGEGKLWDGDSVISLTPKVFQTLVVLLENRERVVSKRELLDAVWPDCHVEDANLTQNISVLRKSLREPESGTRCIATFPRQGYRFIAAVEEEMAAEPPPPTAVPVSIVSRGRRFRRAWVIGLLLLALAAVLLALRIRTPSPLMLGERRTITHLTGRTLQPVISPDGKEVAFVYWRGLRSPLRVGVLSFGQAAEPRMIGTSEGDAYSPTFSPDGRTLAYLQARGDKLKVMLWQPESEPREVAGIFAERYGLSERVLDWSPDGRLLAVCDKSVDEEPFRIELIQIAGGRRIPLTVPPALSDGDFDPRFSPDGKRLAFIRMSSNRTMDLFVVNMPGGDPLRVTAVRQRMTGVDWMPDSQGLLVSTRKSGKAGLWYVPAAEGANTAWQSTSATTQDLVQFSVSRQTGNVVTASAEMEENIWQARLEPKRGAVNWQRLVESTRADFSPVYSPDGRRVVFLSDRSGAQQIWIKEEGREAHQLTFGKLEPYSPAWTAKGDQIVFSSLVERSMYRIAITGGAPVRIPLDATVGAHTSVSPDGASVYLAQRFYIFQAPSTGGHPRLLTDQGGFPLRIPPDGEWIYYVRNRFSDEIWRARRSDGYAERVTDRLRPGCWACWSVNASSLVYVRKGEPGSPARLERMNLATRRSEEIGELPGRIPSLGKGMLALAPDGRSLAAVIAEPDAANVDLFETGAAAARK